MNKQTSSRPDSASGEGKKNCSQWEIHPDIWNTDETDPEHPENEEKPLHGIALREPEPQESDVVPMMVGLQGCPAQALKPIPVCLLNTMQGTIAKQARAENSDSTEEAALEYLEERMKNL